VPEREVFASKWGKSGRAELDDFAKWSEDYLAATPEQRQTMLARGIELATDRREAMLDLIKSDPREALANTPPFSVRKQLPGEVASLLEERVSGMGNVGRIFGMAPPGVTKPVATNDIAMIGGQQYFAYRYGARAIRNGYSNVSIHGVAIANQLAVSASPVKVLEQGESYTQITSDCVVTDNKQVLAPGDVPDQKSAALVGTHAFVMCCPFCIQTFDEQQTAAEGSTSTPMGLSDSGVPGTMGFPGKPPTSQTIGGKGVIFLRVQPSDAAALGQGFPSGSGTSTFVNMAFNNSDNWNARIKRTSYGKAWISTADVTPVLTLPHTTAHYTKDSSGSDSYQWGYWVDDAKAAATAAGYTMSNYSTFCVCHYGYTQFGAAGWGDTTGAGTIWSNGYFQVQLFDHEGGHTFGLPHANSWTSTDGNPLSASRTHVEYGDVSDPMGNAWGSALKNDYNAYYKSYCNWLPDSSVLSVSHPGTYRIRQFDSGSILTSSPMALKISRDSSLDLWVMYRGATVSQSNYNTGAYVLGVAAGVISDSHVLDMNNPASDTANAPLAQGQTFTDSASGISLTTAARGGVAGDEYMYVKVAFAPGYAGAHRLLVNGGIYCFRNVSFNKYLEVPSNSSTAGALPQLGAFTGSAAQQWVAWRNDDGSYSFNHYGTSMWLDVKSNSSSNYANIQQTTQNTSTAQRWDLLVQPDGYLKLRHRDTKQVLTADAGKSGDIITYEAFSPGTEQKWEPVLVGMTEGTYRISPRHAQVLGLGVQNQAAYVGAQVEQQAWDGNPSQRWTMQSLGSGQFRIYPQAQPGMALTISGASTANGAKAVLMPWTGAAEQKWSFTTSGNGWVRLTPSHAINSCLQITGAGTSAGADAELSTYTGATNQQWQFVDSDL
jgi:Ricin-type beta-trefoil lectin domain-like/Ricin-type beta-trefoil lectin domain